MSADRPEAWITGIGLVTSLGEGVEDHWRRLAAGKPVAAPVIDSDRLAPYPMHPLCEVDYETTIPKRGDRRQMGPWQLLGVHSAGLALVDAGIAGDAELCGRTNLIVAAGVGERDHESDIAILEGAPGSNDREAYLNQMIIDTVRPTLFLAQLANLLAGNISIVHNVTGSSRSFMGEEMAGVAAIENAVRRIHARQDELFLVGGSFVAEREEHLLPLVLGKRAWDRPFRPVWQREENGGGAIQGSVGAFLVIEASEHAAQRGARPYACIAEVTSDSRGGAPRGDPASCNPIAALSTPLPEGELLVMSGATGIEPHTSHERACIESLREQGVEPVVRGFSSVLGLSIEPHFIAGVGLAAIAVDRGAAYDRFDDSGFEVPTAAVPRCVLVTTWDQWRGAGAAIVTRAGP